MDMQLNGKSVLLTGASKGFGLDIAKTLAAEGCNIGLCARNGDEVNAGVQALKEMGVNACGAEVDITDSVALSQWVNTCADTLGGIDGIVINASAGGADVEESGWRQNFETDVLATWHFCNAAIPHLEKSSSGSIVALSSTAAVEAFAGPVPFGAMKAAMLNYIGNLAHQLAPQGIRVNSVSPGPIFVEGGAWDKLKQAMPEVYESVHAGIPMGRMGSSSDVATQIALLISPLSGFTTGTNVVIDGCFTKRLQF
jgi:3-oxoacyl-[acyl-carrier protein] reductase